MSDNFEKTNYGHAASENDFSKTLIEESTNYSDAAEAVGDAVVRDFIYFDQTKVLSYLAQLQGGLQRLTERVEQRYQFSEKTDPEMTSKVRTAVEAEISGKVPFLAEGSLSPTYEEERSRTTGGDLARSGRMGQHSIVSTIHHEALKIIEDALGNRLVTATGDLMIMDYDRLIDLTRDTNKYGLLLGKIAKQKYTPLENLKEIHGILSLAVQGKIMALIRDDDSIITSAYLSDRFLTADVRHIANNLGLRASGEYKMVGIYATTDTKRPDFASFFKSMGDTNALVNKILEMAQQSETLDDLFISRSSDAHLYPIAIYREL